MYSKDEQSKTEPILESPQIGYAAECILKEVREMLSQVGWKENFS